MQAVLVLSLSDSENVSSPGEIFVARSSIDSSMTIGRTKF